MNFSVVMPVYLRESAHKAVVTDTLNSIKEAGSYDEIIIIDDASPLNTDFLMEYADKFVRHDTNLGISEAWNAGMLGSQGDYVAIVNDDIKVVSGWLESLAEAFENLATGVSAPMKGGPTVRPSVLPIPPFENPKFYPGYCFMLKRDRFFEPFDNQFKSNCGDTDYWHRIEQAELSLVRTGLAIWHKEGGVLHNMGYQKLSEESIKLFEKKHGYNPQRRFYA